MQILRTWTLRGPNIWADFPVLEVEVDLQELKDRSSDEIPGFNDRLKSWLPSLIEHRCSVGERGGFFQRLERGTYLAHILEHVTLELQSLAGCEVGFGRARETSRDGVYYVAIEFDDEELARACLDTGLRLCLAAVHDQPFDLTGELRRLRELAYDVRLGPSTSAIVRAAKARGIPFRRLNRQSLVQLGFGARARRILTAETDQTSAIAEAVAQDKDLTRSLLRAVGVPVPEGRPVSNAQDAWEAAESIGVPVVVKPRYGNHGRGVATNLSTREQVLKAYQAALEESSEIVVEKFVEGLDHRLLVVGQRLIAAAIREPAHVIGDGRATIEQLVAEVNRDPRRSDGHATPLSFIKLDTISLQVLAEQGYTPQSIPPAGVTVLIRRNANLSTGGTATDVTDQVHPEVARCAVDAARVVGLDIAGIDVIAKDISRPLEEQDGAVVEVNAGPGLRMHLEPSAGTPRPVGQAIVEMLFPPGENGRIPIVAVTGVNGKTTTTRCITHIVRSWGKVVGMTCTDGMFVGGRRLDSRDCSGPQSARAVLLHPSVEAAVFETARGGILREGLGFDRCDVGVVTNIGQGDHLGLRGIETVDELARVKRTIVEAVARNGYAVLNADDPLVAAMAERCDGKVAYFSKSPNSALIRGHLESDGRAVLVDQRAIVMASGPTQERLLPLDQVPMTHGGKCPFQIENALAAAAAAWCLGVPAEVIRQGLQTFAGDAEHSPGRFNVFVLDQATIIIDYAHNASAVSALLAALDEFPAQRRVLVFSGFDRRDEDVVQVGTLLGEGFDRLILFEDRGNPDRRDGELNELLRQGLATGGRVAQVLATPDESAAVELALQDLRSGDLLVIGTETVEATLAAVRQYVHNHPGTACRAPQEPPRALHPSRS